MDQGPTLSPTSSPERHRDTEPRLDPAIHLLGPFGDTSTYQRADNRGERRTSIPSAEDANAFDFTFSEDDLIPDEHGRPEPSLMSLQSYGHDRSSVASYDRRPAAMRRESKITIERTLLVSDDGAGVDETSSNSETSVQASNEAPRQSRHRGLDTRVPDPDEPSAGNKSQRLSRTFTSLSRNAGLSRAYSSPILAEGAAERDPRVRPVLPGRNKTLEVPHNKKQSVVGGGGGSSGVDDSDGHQPARSRSLLGRKFRSLRDNSPFRQTSDTPTDKLNGASSPTKRPKTPLIKSFSNNSLTSMSVRDRPIPIGPQTLANSTSKKHHSVSTTSKTKDALWGAFRDLDIDFAKFQSKSIALKPAVIRNKLFFFLRTYASDEDMDLRPIDLDRRTIILDKWWTGLLDLLFTKVGLSSTGAERLLVLDAIAGIMERPEWRLAFRSHFSAADSTHEGLERRPKSGDSAKSNVSDFVNESIFHNMRTTFAHNLGAQMRFVVDRMTPTHVSPSISGFCGKTCAYAFLYCPGMADVLVSLWSIKATDIQRILRASGFRRGKNMHTSAASISTAFPRCVQPQAFSSIRGTMQMLQQFYEPAIGLEKIPWHGNWLGRWRGRDTDLFYAFVKQYHYLVASIIPPSITKEELLSAPGMVLVSAQMLVNLDATIHRRATHGAAEPGVADASVTFDALLAADASPATAMSTPINAIRIVAENRLLMLMREMAEDTSRQSFRACSLFAQSFKRVLHSATQGTSLFDHSACFTLCDILQEAIPGLIHFQQRVSPEQPLLDWQFWLSVFQRIIQSQNTTSEIRLYSLLFAIWEHLAKDEQRIAQLSLGLLLDEEHFRRSFRHWCPMVRAYYMRLLCWRLARCDGSGDSEVDSMVVSLLMRRLRDMWAHHQIVAQDADRKGLLLPSTAPCNPAPGRKLLIIRTDTFSINNVMSLQRMMPAGQRTKFERASSDDEYDDSTDDGHAGTSASLLERVVSSMDSGAKARRRSGILGTILGYGPPESRSRSRSPKKPLSNEAGGRHQVESQATHTDASASASPIKRPGSNSRMSMYEPRPSPDSSPEKPEDADRPNAALKRIPKHVQAAFKFSLEPTDRRPQALPANLVLDAPRLPLAAQVMLQMKKGINHDATPTQISAIAADAIRYSGRALAEWTLVVNEYQNFFDRRRNEGVPNNALVETPVLGVESFRKIG